MANNLTMADLLAKQSANWRTKPLSLSRNQEIEGTVIAILPQEIILDLGTKAEGVIQKKDLSDEEASNLKVGDKLKAIVIYTENEFGQAVLSPAKGNLKGIQNQDKWKKFIRAKESNETLRGKGLEINKGGLVVEVSGIRGFLPSSQVSLSQASDLDALIGREIEVNVIEVDPAQNRLILAKKTEVSEEVKDKLNTIKVGDEVEGKVAAVLPFGIFVTLPDGVEGLVHVSELSWEKVEDPGSLYKVSDQVKAKVIQVDGGSGRVNLSVKQTGKDPFEEKVAGIKKDDVIKAEVTKVTSQGVFAVVDGVEGFIPANKAPQDKVYEVGETVTCTVDNIDTQKRRLNLAPFITSTQGLIYK